MTTQLTEGYKHDLLGVVSCYDCIVNNSSLPGACYARGMTSYLYAHQIKTFDFTKVFADPLRNRIRDNAQMLTKTYEVAIEHVNNSRLRKGNLVSKVLAQRGYHPGLMHILSAMEACSAYKSWHDKKTHTTYLCSTPGKCLHYYFYFMDAEVGPCYLRVPTWCPFRLQFYCNGHSWLARKLNF